MQYTFTKDPSNPLYETSYSIQYPMAVYQDKVLYLFFSRHAFDSRIEENPASRKSIEMTWTKDFKYFRSHDTILRTSEKGWDSERIEGHCILDDGSKYRMAYCGFDGKQWSVGIAHTVGLSSWGKYLGNPIIKDAYDPVYVYWKGYYRLYYGRYEGKTEIYGSFSEDGLTNWTHHMDPVIRRGNAQWVAPTAVIPTDDLLFILYHMRFGEHRMICVAYSHDGVIFNTAYPNVLISSPKEGWDAGRILHTHACKIKGEWNIFYAALDNEGKGKIGRGIFEYSME